MKIGFIGNMNNNFFGLVRYMRDRGVDAELILLCGEFGHFHPSTDSFSLDYRDFTRSVTWGSREMFSRTSPSQIRSDLAEYDTLFGTGLAAAYLSKAGRRLDVFKVYGGDLMDETRYQFITRRPVVHNQISRHQRKGIGDSRFFCMGWQNEMYESYAKRFAGNSVRLLRPIPMVYAPEYTRDSLSQNRNRLHFSNFFDQLRASSDFIAFSHSRQSWTISPTNANHKGSDRIFHAWSKFLKSNPGLNAKLVVFEYGRDVAESKRLVRECGICDSVEWLPPTSRKEIMYGLSVSDVSVGPCSDVSWNISGNRLEAMVSAAPQICHRDDSLYAGKELPVYPVFNARTTEEIHDQLCRVLSNPELARSYGDQGLAWYQDHLAKNKIDEYLSCLST